MEPPHREALTVLWSEARLALKQEQKKKNSCDRSGDSREQ